jgi:hypothetical protein
MSMEVSLTTPKFNFLNVNAKVTRTGGAVTPAELQSILANTNGLQRLTVNADGSYSIYAAPPAGSSNTVVNATNILTESVDFSSITRRQQSALPPQRPAEMASGATVTSDTSAQLPHPIQLSSVQQGTSTVISVQNNDPSSIVLGTLQVACSSTVVSSLAYHDPAVEALPWLSVTSNATLGPGGSAQFTLSGIAPCNDNTYVRDSVAYTMSGSPTVYDVSLNIGPAIVPAMPPAGIFALVIGLSALACGLRIRPARPGAVAMET